MTNLVSVVTPCYNSAKTICETIDSVLNQTYKNIEIILIDDGSQDNTKEEIKPYLDKYPFIQYIYQINQGQSVARNTGARQAKGHYLLFLDADDLIAPAYIERCVAVLETRPDVKLAYSRGRLFDAVDANWDFPPYSFVKLLKNNLIYVSAVMRKTDFDKFGPYDEKLGFYEDWDLWISMLEEAGDVVLLDERMFFYRKRHDRSSLTNKMDIDKKIDIDNRKRIYEKHKETYIKVFGTHFDILQTLIRQEAEIEYLRKKNNNRFSKKIRRFFKRFKSEN